MSPELFSCCKSASHSSSWIFIYQNSDIYGICDVHFTSEAHRAFVKYAINMKMPEQIFLPHQIFGDVLIEKMS